MQGTEPEAVGGHVADDRELLQRASGGDKRAFELLYRRHAPAAHRVAYSVAGNPDDAADAVAEAFTRILAGLPSGRILDAAAFRPYLMAATRNAAIDQLRRKGRVQPTDVVDLAERPAPTAGPPERILSGEDQSLVAQAFKDLPERWRSVLWLTEIEGIPPREVGERMGISPNGASQLAVRARAGLRDRYLQAHVREATNREDCRYTLFRLGAYVGGGLAPREIAKVDQHLAGCEKCRQAKDELEDLGTSLRRVILPIPLVLGGVALGRWAAQTVGEVLATSAVAPAGGAALVAGKGIRSSLTAAHKAVAAAAAGVLAAGAIAASTVAPPADPSSRDGGSSKPTTVADPPIFDPDPTKNDPVQIVATAFGGRVPSKATPPPVIGSPMELARGDVDAGDPGDADDPPPPPPRAKPVAQAGTGGRLGAASGGVSAGLGDGSCTGAAAGPAATGCSPPVPTGNGLTVATGGEVLPEQEIALP